jgi:hypothetical protein
MLSVFITPWMKPTFIHCAISAAWRADTRSSRARKRPGVPTRSGSWRAMLYSASWRTRSTSPRAAKYWNVPTRMWLAATRVSTAPGSTVSRNTGWPVATTASARVVGMPRACIASPISTSRSIGPTAALPSPPREKRRPAGALQGDVAAPAGAIDHLAEQHRPAVAELRREAAELMAGIRLGDRLGAFGNGVAGEESSAGLARQDGGVETELLGQRRVEEQRLRRRCGLRAPGHGKALELAGVGVFEAQEAAAAMGDIRGTAASLNDFAARVRRRDGRSAETGCIRPAASAPSRRPPPAPPCRRASAAA